MKIKSIHLENILSFDKLDLELGDINVIMGPNNSGKTNVVRVLNFVKDLDYYVKNRVFEQFVKAENREEPFLITLDIELSDEEKNKLERYISVYYEIEMRGAMSEIEKGLDKILPEKIQLPVTRETIKKASQFVEMIFNLMSDYVQNKIKEILDPESISIVCFYSGFSGEQPITYLKLKNGYAIHKYGHLTIFEKILVKSTSYFELGRSVLTHNILREVLISYLQSSNPGEIISFKYKDKIKEMIVQIFEKIPERGLLLTLEPGKINNEKKKKEILRQIYYIFDKTSSYNVSYWNLPRLIKEWYDKSVILTNNIRMNSQTNRLLECTRYFEGSGNAMYYLPYMLLKLKNSLDRDDRRRYHDIENLFEKLTGYRFNVWFSPDSYIIESKNEKSTQASTEILIKEQKEVKKEQIFPDGWIGINIFKKNDVEIPIELSGAGLNELLYILYLIVGARNKTIFLDEPASNLHPLLQRKLMELIVDYRYKNQSQFVVITHSPYLLPSFCEKEENNQNTSKIKYVHFRLANGNTKAVVMEFTENVRKYCRQLDERKVIFFSDAILVLEGLSDEYIFRKLLEIHWERLLIKKNIEVISFNGGDTAKEVYDILRAEWELNAFLILDHDKERKHSELTSKNNVFFLPSDIEGTILFGEILALLKKLCKNYSVKYEPHFIFKKFGGWLKNESKFENKKNKLEKIMKTLEEGDIQKITEMILKTSDNLMEKLTEEDRARICECARITSNKLNTYIDAKIFVDNKLNHAVRIVEYDHFFETMPEDLKSFLEENVLHNNS